jgi:prepilin-type N-terminal cleavage/methylation domain-containing protein
VLSPVAGGTQSGQYYDCAAVHKPGPTLFIDPFLFFEGGIDVGQCQHATCRGDDGFTLTELLIVIVVLGVLSGIVLLAVGQFSNRGRSSACEAAMKTTEVAIETYRANVGTFPPDIATLVPAYLREVPSTSNYTITYFPTGRAATSGPLAVTALAPGAVIGDVVGGAVTEDCSA